VERERKMFQRIGEKNEAWRCFDRMKMGESGRGREEKDGGETLCERVIEIESEIVRESIGRLRVR
jgi:hypothetical protein